MPRCAVLIALHIKNWNEWRKERVNEKKALQEIVKTLELNNQIMQENIGVLVASNKSALIVLSFVNN